MNAVPWKARGLAGAIVCLSVLIAQSEHRSFAQEQTNNMDMPERVLLTAGRSTVLNTDFDITRIAVTNPEVADATVVKPREVLVDGKGAGTVSLIIWGATTRKHYDVVVDRGVSTLQQNLASLFPGENINVGVTDDAVILSGAVSSNEVMLRAAEVAKAALPKGSIINMLQLPGGSPSKQVLLQVRFAEVNRNAIQEAGINLFVNRDNFAARSSTGQFAAPTFDKDNVLFSDFLNLFFYSKSEGIGGVLKALEGRGFLQSLAEPNLIAYNGEEASFLAGGEIPVPVVSGNTGNVSVTYKEFGIRLTFRPTIAGDVIRLKVKPEVSTLDFSNGVILSGFRIPALITRRAETDVELRDGQSFAVAGLLNNLSQTDRQAIPLLSRLPIIGNLFKSKASRAEQTELMVLITPRLVRPLDPDEVPALPTRPGAFLTPDEKENKESYSSEPSKPDPLVDAPPMAPETGKKPLPPPPPPPPGGKKPPKR
jgi:pilus assembly protein CpaC